MHTHIYIHRHVYIITIKEKEACEGWGLEMLGEGSWKSLEEGKGGRK